MGSVLAAALGYIVRSLKNPSAAGNSNESLSVAIINIVGTIRVIASGFDQVFSRLRKAYGNAANYAANLETIIDDTSKWDADNWSRLTEVILPRSLYVTSDDIHKWATKRFIPWSWLRSKQWTDVVSKAGTGYTFWQTYHYWLRDFTANQWPGLLAWRQKRVEPQLAQLWALNPNAYPLEAVILDKAATYLHSKRGATDLYNLTGMIIAEAPYRPRTLEKAVLAWLQTEIS